MKYDVRKRLLSKFQILHNGEERDKKKKKIVIIIKVSECNQDKLEIRELLGEKKKKKYSDLKVHSF